METCSCLNPKAMESLGPDKVNQGTGLKIDNTILCFEFLFLLISINIKELKEKLMTSVFKIHFLTDLRRK